MKEITIREDFTTLDGDYMEFINDFYNMGYDAAQEKLLAHNLHKLTH